MTLLPELGIGLENAWWFPAAYGVIMLVLIAVFPRHFSKRLLHFPPFKSLKERAFTMLGAFLFGRGLMIYSIFVPLRLNTVWFWTGLSIFTIGILLSTIAMINFATTPPDQPVVKGLYRISRNPIQVLAVIMWLGVGIATASLIIIMVSLLLAIISYPSFIAQERYCLESYGDPYREYMKVTPRYLLF